MQVPSAHGQRDGALRAGLLGRGGESLNSESYFVICVIFMFQLLTSYGWVECVGCADRSAYDLTQHTQATGVKLCAEKKLAEPITKDVTEIAANKGPLFKVL